MGALMAEGEGERRKGEEGRGDEREGGAKEEEEEEGGWEEEEEEEGGTKVLLFSGRTGAGRRKGGRGRDSNKQGGLYSSNSTKKPATSWRRVCPSWESFLGQLTKVLFL